MPPQGIKPHSYPRKGGLINKKLRTRPPSLHTRTQDTIAIPHTKGAGNNQNVQILKTTNLGAGFENDRLLVFFSFPTTLAVGGSP